MSSSLRNKTINATIWSVLERFSVQGVQFLLGLILARLLSPTDYGLIGMIAVFNAISQNFIDSGFSNALIRKKDRTVTDMSTVYYFNIGASLFFYILLYLAAPFIADFYQQPILTSLVRVVGINIIISAFGLIHRTKLSIDINFKSQAKSAIFSVLISGSIGLACAYYGFGVWALVIQTLSANVVTTIILWNLSKWHPRWLFSWQSFKELFSYGSRLLGAGLLDTVFNNLYYIVIGKFFDPKSLGFYTRARGFSDFPSSNITGIIQRVTFPVLSQLQNDDQALRNGYKKYYC